MNDAPVDIVVYGNPKPQGSLRHVGKGILVNKPELLDWRRDITLATHAAMDGRLPLEGAIDAHIVFTVPKPKSAPKTRVTWPITRPDLDKLVRGALDALTYGGAWIDDSQVTSITAFKAYPNEHSDSLPIPGVRIRLRVTS